MENDRKLLELAALAMEVEGEYWEQPNESDPENPRVGIGRTLWNPLVSDAAAFDTAARLRLVTSTSLTEAIAVAHGIQAIEFFGLGYPNPALRRAITRAAADIGAGKRLTR